MRRASAGRRHASAKSCREMGKDTQKRPGFGRLRGWGLARFCPLDGALLNHALSAVSEQKHPVATTSGLAACLRVLDYGHAAPNAPRLFWPFWEIIRQLSSKIAPRQRPASWRAAVPEASSRRHVAIYAAVIAPSPPFVTEMGCCKPNPPRKKRKIRKAAPTAARARKSTTYGKRAQT